MMDDKWDSRFLEIAEHVSSWSKDPSTRVGAIIVRGDRTIASVGYNGFPRGVADDEARYEDKPTKYLMVVHAEMNAILSMREPVTADHVLYVTPLHPCSNCASAIIQSGIKKVVTQNLGNENWAEHHKVAGIMFEEAGVEVKFVGYYE